MDRYLFFWKCILTFILGVFFVIMVDSYEQHLVAKEKHKWLLKSLTIKETYE
jgi:hypothetical protein